MIIFFVFLLVKEKKRKTKKYSFFLYSPLIQCNLKHVLCCNFVFCFNYYLTFVLNAFVPTYCCVRNVQLDVYTYNILDSMTFCLLVTFNLVPVLLATPCLALFVSSKMFHVVLHSILLEFGYCAMHALQLTAGP